MALLAAVASTRLLDLQAFCVLIVLTAFSNTIALVVVIVQGKPSQKSSSPPQRSTVGLLLTPPRANTASANQALVFTKALPAPGHRHKHQHHNHHHRHDSRHHHDQNHSEESHLPTEDCRDRWMSTSAASNEESNPSASNLNNDDDDDDDEDESWDGVGP